MLRIFLDEFSTSCFLIATSFLNIEASSSWTTLIFIAIHVSRRSFNSMIVKLDIFYFTLRTSILLNWVSVCWKHEFNDIMIQYDRSFSMILIHICVMQSREVVMIDLSEVTSNTWSMIIYLRSIFRIWISNWQRIQLILISMRIKETDRFCGLNSRYLLLNI